MVVALALSASPSSAGPPDPEEVRVAILSRAQRSHREAAATLQQGLRHTGYESILIELPAGVDEPAEEQALRELVAARPTVVAAGGTKATSLALERLPETPVVFFLVPNALDAPFMAPDSPDRQRVTGVTTDLAPDGQLDWLATLCPRVKTIGILTSPRSRKTALTIKAAETTRGLTVVPIETNKGEFMRAIEALNASGCDAALMIPDAQVYNSLSVQRLLLWGIRQKKPVSAFSANVVKAGALTGRYGDNRVIGRQTAGLVVQVLEGADVSLLGLQYPDHVNHAVSERTAELIGIQLEPRHQGPDTIRFGNGQ